MIRIIMQGRNPQTSLRAQRSNPLRICSTNCFVSDLTPNSELPTPNWLSTKQILHIFSTQCLYKCGVVGDEFPGQGSLFFLELQDFIFNGVLTNHTVSEDVLGLSNAVCAVNSLLLYCRIPPWINDVYIICGSKVQSHTTRFQ